MVLDEKFSQEYPLDAGVHKSLFILGLKFSYYTLMTSLLMLSVILPSILMMLLSILKFHQASYLWQQLELSMRHFGWGQELTC